MKRMGSSNSSRSLAEERQSDEIVKPFWRLVTEYIDELFGLRQSKPVVLSSTSDTIGIGRPLYMDMIKRVYPKESVHCNRGENDDDGQSQELSKTTKEAPDESSVSVATSRRLLSDHHRTGNDSLGSSCVGLDELRRRGVTVIQCHNTPRQLPPPPPTEDDDIAASTDSTRSSLGPPDNTTHEEVVVPPPADSSYKAQFSRKQTKCSRTVAVMPENHFPYSIQDSRHWNKTIVLTETGSRVAWTTRREVHSLRMQHWSDARLERSTAVHPPDASCDTMGREFAGSNLRTVCSGQRPQETSIDGAIEDSRRQYTRSELLECLPDEEHQPHCGRPSASEHVIPGSSEHQRTHPEKRHPIVTNILVMLGAETKDNKVSDAEQRVPNTTLQTTTNHAKQNIRTRLFETSSPRTEDTMALSPHSTELRSTGVTQVSSHIGVPEIVCPLNTMRELCKTRSTAPDDRIQRSHHSETPTSKTMRPLPRKVPQHIGRTSTAELVRFLSFIYT